MRVAHTNPSRRSVVFGGSAIAALSAAGCCSFPPAPQAPSSCSSRPSPFLAGPEVRAAWSRPERYFDAHAHFFNAQDVPVAGFLSKSVAHGVKSDILRKLIIALAPVAEALASLAPTPASEMNVLCSRAGTGLKTLRENSDDLDRSIEEQRDDVARQFYRRISIQGGEIPALFNEALAPLSANPRSPGLRGMLTRESTFNQQFVIDALRNGGSFRDTSTNRLVPMRSFEMSPELVQVASMNAALQFVGFMLSPRHHNLRTFIRRFAEGSPDLPLSGCFAAMVDFNYWLDCPAKASPMEDQVRIHAQLSLLSQGFMMPLVAYNPWVDIIERDASFNLVHRAITEHGCVGVKIYPPMGFYPFNNVGIPLETKEKRPDVAKLDAKLQALYELCDSLGVPVMAHANETMGRDQGHDVLAGSRGWADLRDKVTTLKALRVNAGHFGGAQDSDTHRWTDDFVKLMSEPGALQVYGDLGYWNELLEEPYVKDKLGRVLQTSLATGGIVADRVMYGSDWHMLSKEPGWEQYGSGVVEVLRGLDPAGRIAQKVLGANVLDCFGLTKGSGRSQLERLVGFHADQGAGAPGWLGG